MLLARGSNEGIQENSWYLVKGASNHMFEKKKKHVCYLDEWISGNVSFANYSDIPIKGEGNILSAWKMEYLNLFQMSTTSQTWRTIFGVSDNS